MAGKGGGHTLVALMAVVVMLIGLTFLFRNFDLLPWGLWGTLWRLWPVLLVVLGIYLVIGRSRPGLAAGLSILAIAVAFTLSWAWGQRSVSGSFSQPLSGVERAEITIEFGVGELALESLPPTSADLVRGEFEHQGAAQTVNQKLTVEGKVGRLDLSGPVAARRFLGDSRQDWQVGITPRIPLELAIKAGASRGQFDLRDLRLSRLRLDIGASKVSMTLPRAPLGTLDAQVKAGAADMTIIVPQGVEVQIRPEDGLSTVKVNEERFLKRGDSYSTPGYSQAENRIRLNIASGLAKIEVK